MTAADMSGHYHLTGQREMGSELMLRPDGTFEHGRSERQHGWSDASAERRVSCLP